ncbi:MAG: hypothetical protein ABI718_13960 [Acidobacteriota bacterium]
MSTGNKTLLGVIGCLLFGVVVLAIAGALVWHHQRPAMMRAARASEAQGRAEGSQLDEQRCLYAAIDRHRKPENVTFSATFREGMRLTGCLRASKLTKEFCDSVPSKKNPINAGTWGGMRCRGLGFTDPYCGQMFERTIEYCQSESRQKKVAAVR